MMSRLGCLFRRLHASIARTFADARRLKRGGLPPKQASCLNHTHTHFPEPPHAPQTAAPPSPPPTPQNNRSSPLPELRLCLVHFHHPVAVERVEAQQHIPQLCG